MSSTAHPTLPLLKNVRPSQECPSLVFPASSNISTIPFTPNPSCAAVSIPFPSATTRKLARVIRFSVSRVKGNCELNIHITHRNFNSLYLEALFLHFPFTLCLILSSSVRSNLAPFSFVLVLVIITPDPNIHANRFELLLAPKSSSSCSKAFCLLLILSS